MKHHFLRRFLGLLIGLSFFSGPALAQLPPLPPLPDPLGIFGNSSGNTSGNTSGSSSQQTVNAIYDSGMSHSVTQPPFGVDATGNPQWPIQAPPPPSPAPTSGTTGSANPVKDLQTTPADSGVSLEQTLDKVNQVPVRGKMQPAEVRPLLGTDLTEGGATTLPTAPSLTGDEVNRLKAWFLYDVQRHARAVFEGKNAQALQIALKWQALGKMHPTHIETITGNIAARKGASSFAVWIDGIVQEDWKHVQK